MLSMILAAAEAATPFLANFGAALGAGVAAIAAGIGIGGGCCPLRSDCISTRSVHQVRNT